MTRPEITMTTTPTTMWWMCSPPGFKSWNHQRTLARIRRVLARMPRNVISRPEREGDQVIAAGARLERAQQRRQGRHAQGWRNVKVFSGYRMRAHAAAASRADSWLDIPGCRTRALRTKPWARSVVAKAPPAQGAEGGCRRISQTASVSRWRVSGVTTSAQGRRKGGTVETHPFLAPRRLPVRRRGATRAPKA